MIRWSLVRVQVGAQHSRTVATMGTPSKINSFRLLVADDGGLGAERMNDYRATTFSGHGVSSGTGAASRQSGTSSS